MGVRDDDRAARRWATLSFLLALGGCTWAVVAAIGLEACETTTFFGDTVADEACVQDQTVSLVVASVLAVVGIIAQTVVSFRSGRNGAGVTTVLSFTFPPLFVVGYIVFLATKPDRSRHPPVAAPVSNGAANGTWAEAAPWPARSPEAESPFAPASAPVPASASAIAYAVDPWQPAGAGQADGVRALAMQRRLARIKAAHTELDLTQASILLERFEGGDEASGARLDAVLAGMEDGLQFRRHAAPTVTYHDARTVAGDLVQGGKVMSDVRDSVVTGNIAPGQDASCGTCGTALSGSAKFCPACGAAQPGAGRLGA